MSILSHTELTSSKLSQSTIFLSRSNWISIFGFSSSDMPGQIFLREGDIFDVGGGFRRCGMNSGVGLGWWKKGHWMRVAQDVRSGG